MAVAPSHVDEAPLLAHGLYERHATALRGFCLHRSANRADAEEAVQATFLRALSAMRAGVRPRAERAWLLTIARNVCATQSTRAHRRHEVALEPAMLEAQAEDEQLDRTADPDLIAALEALPEGQRRAFVLRAVDGLSYHEIAAELGVSHAAVETWIFRARRKLAAAVGESRRRLAHATSLAGAAKSLFAGSAALKATAAASLAIATVAGAGPAVRDRLDDRGTTPAPAREDRVAPIAPAAPAAPSSTPAATKDRPQAVEQPGPSRQAHPPSSGRTMSPGVVPAATGKPETAPSTPNTVAPATSTSAPKVTTPTAPPIPVVEDVNNAVNRVVEPVVELVDPLVTPIVEAVEPVVGPLPAVPTLPLPVETPPLELPVPKLPPLP